MGTEAVIQLHVSQENFCDTQGLSVTFLTRGIFPLATAPVPFIRVAPAASESCSWSFMQFQGT